MSLFSCPVSNLCFPEREGKRHLPVFEKYQTVAVFAALDNHTCNCGNTATPTNWMKNCKLQKKRKHARAMISVRNSERNSEKREEEMDGC